MASGAWNDMPWNDVPWNGETFGDSAPTDILCLSATAVWSIDLTAVAASEIDLTALAATELDFIAEVHDC